MRPARKFSQHAEWRSLIEIAGPFLSDKALKEAFPQGLDKVQTPKKQRLRSAYEEWSDALDQRDPALPELHREWVSFVLRELLEYDEESLVATSKLPEEQRPQVIPQERSGRLAADFVVRSPQDGSLRLLVCVVPPGTDLEKAHGDQWSLPLHERLTLLCRQSQVRLGLLTNGERWMLVNAPVGSTSGHASWYARLWFQEPVTLQAFQSLFSVRRCFGPSKETLDTLLQDSLEHHDEITNTLGEQVRRAVEVLVQCLDKADVDRNRELLQDVTPAELYEAGLTVMMRLVFTLCAEERGLLLLGDETYDQFYAVSSLRAQLTEDSDRHGDEVLERRHDAWARLLALFRAVHGGVEHENLRLPALGGSLFDPDRFPFLEGRPKGSRWLQDVASPLPIDNRTVLLLLNSLQVLEQSGGARLLSYRALDVEQIGHVYEGLLENTVVRVSDTTLGLQGAQNPCITLAAMESAHLNGETALVKLLLDITGRSEPAIKSGLTKNIDGLVFNRVLGVCCGDATLAERIRPYANLLRTDAWDDSIVYRENSFMVTLGPNRRETGAHYTPKSLTEGIVCTTLESVVYIGPAEGNPREKWVLKSSREILDLKVCDPAMGSGAFLVQACRYLGEKLVEAWQHEVAAGKAISVDGEVLDLLGEAEHLPSEVDCRLTIARRLVAERCLYGVDINPLAVELAKLSIWLVTLAKGSPFGFLDHSLRSGDSLLGIHKLEQLTELSMTPAGATQLRLFGQSINHAAREALELRVRLREMPIRDIRDIKAMAHLDAEARSKLEVPECIANAFIGEVFVAGSNTKALEVSLAALSIQAEQVINGDRKVLALMNRKSATLLSTDLPVDSPERRPFHWPLMFPEVFCRDKAGFDALIGNPPFMGGKRITGALGEAYREYLVNNIANGRRGNADLCGYFILRVAAVSASSGTTGMIATSTLSQGETRQICLGFLKEEGFSIFKAVKSFDWPGKANLSVTKVWLYRGKWHGQFNLNGEDVNGITPALTTQGSVTGEPQRLAANIGKAFQGSNARGMGFVLTNEEALKLIDDDPKNKDVIFPFLGGDDILSIPNHSPSRWIINFFDWDKERAATYTAPFHIAMTLVLPERMKIKDEVKRNALSRDFWRYDSQAKSMYRKIAGMTRYMVHPLTSKHHIFQMYSPGITIAHTAAIVALSRWDEFALLQSRVHWAWALEYGNKLATRPQYLPTTCFDTFPFPNYIHQNLNELGEVFHKKRTEAKIKENIGATALHNMIDNSLEVSTDIAELRELTKKIDEFVLLSYGWDDIDLQYGFHTTNQGVRFTFSETAKFEILQRLLDLNHTRYKEEAAQELNVLVRDSEQATEVAPKEPKLRPKKNPDNGHAQFDFAQAHADPQQAITTFLSQNPGHHPKAAILTATSVTDTQWTKAIKALVDGGFVKQEGEKKGARYEAACSNKRINS